MKKIKILTILFLIVSLVSTPKIAFGFSNDIFSIDVPNSFKTDINFDNDKKEYIFTKDYFSISILVAPYTGKIYDINSTTCEDLIKEKNLFIKLLSMQQYPI